MTLEDLDRVAAGRHVFPINARLVMVVLEPVHDLVLVRLFFDGQLLGIVEAPAGET